MSQQESPEAFRDRARAWAVSNLPRADGQVGMEVGDEEELRIVDEDRDLQRAIFDSANFSCIATDANGVIQSAAETSGAAPTTVECDFSSPVTTSTATDLKVLVSNT